MDRAAVLVSLSLKQEGDMIRSTLRLDHHTGRQDSSKMSIQNRWLEALPTHQMQNHVPGSGIFLCESSLPEPQDRYRLVIWPQWNFLAAPQPTKCFVVTA